MTDPCPYSETWTVPPPVTASLPAAAPSTALGPVCMFESGSQTVHGGGSVTTVSDGR